MTASAPTITSFTPTSGPVGTAVAINGTNLTGTTVVGFNGHHPTSFMVNGGGTQITTTVPTGATTGKIAVIAPGGEAFSSTDFTVTTTPAAPANLIATAGNGLVNLSWTAPAGTVTSYSLYRGTAPGGEGVPPIQTGITGTTATDPGLTNGTTDYYTVRAVNSAGSSPNSNEASATPVNRPPTVATPAAATPNPATGTTTVLTVTGADDLGPGNLTYTWAATGTPPAPVTYSGATNGTNGASTITASFTKAGAYSLQVTIMDSQGASVASSVNVTVSQTLTSIVVSPASASVATGATQQFMATANDQFGIALGTQPTFTWSVSGGGTISGNGLFTAGATAGGPFTVTAKSGSVRGTASVTVTSGTISVPQNLVALPEYNSVALYWQIAYGTSYNVYRASVSGGPYTLLTTNPITIATYTDTSATNGNTYYYVVTAVVSGMESGYSNESSAVPGAIPPSDLAAYATGSGKISLYWSHVPNAIGYNIYRGTTTGGENYAAPINGATPVNTASYTGSSLDIYTDIGLTDGTDYFYTIKAVYGSGMSAPSTEDTDTPDPSAVPWDSRNPSSVLAVFRSVFASDISNQGTGSYSLRVVGPDNSIYDDSYSTVQPPDGTLVPGTNQFTGSDGTTVSLPDDLGQYDVPPSGMSPQIVGSTLGKDFGPYRRVRTLASYRGESGIITLPAPTITDLGVKHDDYADIYLGASGVGLQVDAGLQFSTMHGWEMFMSINRQYVGNKPGIPAVHLFNHPPDFVRVPPGDSPLVAYWAWGTFPSQQRAKLSLLLVDDSLSPGGIAGAIGAASRYLGKAESIRAKRVHTIAQNAPGVYPTGSQMSNATWSQGNVALADGSSSQIGWSTSDGVAFFEDGSYEGGHSTISANEDSPYIEELGISIVIDSH